MIRLSQPDFAAGMWRGTARHLIPQQGAYDIINGLLDDDGAVYRRGGSAYHSATALGTGLKWLWDGYLHAGHRTVFASNTSMAVLEADDTTLRSINSAVGIPEPIYAVELGGILWLENGPHYAGTRQVGPYETGTIAVTNGSRTVIGTGTLWLANVQVGALLNLAGERSYIVDSVNSDTSITLHEGYEGASRTGIAYQLGRTRTTTSPYRLLNGPIATVANRLVHGDQHRIHFSAGINETTGRPQPHVWNATDFHALPQGERVLALRGLGDRLMVFATGGLWVISNMSYDLTDFSGAVQHRMELVSPDFILWGGAGIAGWENALVVPATSGVHIVDGSGRPELVSGSINGLYREYVGSGYRPGGAAVYRGHYFLPVLDATATNVIDLLVCRLERPVRTQRGTVWPWTRLDGHGSRVAALTVRALAGGVRGERLLGAGMDGRVLNLTGVFDQTVGTRRDADGSSHLMRIDTRDFSTGGAMVRRLRLTYVMEGVATDAPQPVVTAYVGVGEVSDITPKWDTAAWDGFSWAASGDATSTTWEALSGTAGASQGDRPMRWAFARRARHIRFRIEATGPAAKLSTQGLDVEFRQIRKAA